MFTSREQWAVAEWNRIADYQNLIIKSTRRKIQKDNHHFWAEFRTLFSLLGSIGLCSRPSMIVGQRPSWLIYLHRKCDMNAGGQRPDYVVRACRG